MGGSLTRGIMGLLTIFFRATLKLVLLIFAVYPLLLFMMHFTADVFLPNGGYLNRNIDMKSGSRVDLYRTEWGQVISRDVNWLCWNERAVLGSGRPESFIWLGGESEPILYTHPAYKEALRESGLRRDRGGCNGYYRALLDPEILIDRLCRARPTATNQFRYCQSEANVFPTQ